MKVLALELSTTRGSIAIADDDEVIMTRDWLNDRRHSRPFFVSLAEMVQSHRGVNAIVVGLGPGSYTGTRIAISAAVGLQMTLAAELYGLASICAVSTEKNYAVVGDAKRGSFFFAMVENGGLCRAPELLSSSELTKRIAQTGLPVYTSDDLPQFSEVKLQFPSADLLCHLPRTAAVLPPLTPLYLRPPHITTPRRLL